MHPLSPPPFLLLAVVASVLQRASALFYCSENSLYTYDWNAANRLDSAVHQSQGETPNFYCNNNGDGDNEGPLFSDNCERDASLLEATVNASGNNVDFYCDGSYVLLGNCANNLQHLNAIATSGTNYPTPSGSTSAPTSSTPSSTPTTTAPSQSPASSAPTAPPTTAPSPSPSAAPTAAPATSRPTGSPSLHPTSSPATSVPTAPPAANPTHSPTTSQPTEVGATWSPTTGPSADVTPPPELTAPATTLQSDPDEQQSTEDSSGDGVQTYLIVALSLVVVALIIYIVFNKRKKHAPFAPNQPDNSTTVTNPTHNAQHVRQSAPTVSGDVADTYEVGQTLNPNYEPTLPERMGNRLYAEIQPNEEPHSGSYATLRGDQQVHDQFYERPPDRLTNSSA